MHNNIFITGGAGFIGSRLATALQKDNPGSRIWVYDNLHPQVHGINAEPPVFTGNIQFIKGDVADKAAFDAAILKCQPGLVYHLAAETGTGQSYDEVSRYCEVNVTGTANLVEAIRKHSSSTTRRVVLAASRAVYGEGGYCDAAGSIFTGLPRQAEAMQAGDYSVPMPAAAKLPVVAIPSDTQLAPAPASVYASTKLMQEYIVEQTGEGASWESTALRFQNVYGPGQSLNNPYTGVLSIFANQLLDGKTLSIYEDGDISRDFVFVDDAVSALVQAGKKDLPHGTTLDIGSGDAVSILEVAQQLMTYLGFDTGRYKVTGEFRIGDIRYACANISAASELLAWAPRMGIENGLRLLSDWARKEYMSKTK